MLGVSIMPAFDPLDARVLLALNAQPRATTLALAETTGVSRNTVQARLTRLDDRGVLRSFEHRIDPAALGYPLTAFITIIVRQQQLDEVGEALAEVPEVLEVFGMSGQIDLLARVVARDADDLYRIAGQILATSGVERTETALTMRRMVDYRVGPLLERAARR
jgi:DNA-binding Lrp family transcriptional regulator